MINQELSVVHLGEYLHVGVGVEFEQMLYLWFGHECLLGAVPDIVKIGVNPLLVHPYVERLVV